MSLLTRKYQKLTVAILLIASMGLVACSKFLDIVPDNVATIEHAFKLRNEAEKYLFTLYSYLPENGNLSYNIGMLAGDEIWIPYQRSLTSHAFEIARGNQRKASPYVNVWQGNYQGGGPGDNYGLFKALRHCNIFIENISDENQVPDLSSMDRTRWLGEAEFLKAYYHFYLLRMYGPIPLIKNNLDVDEDIEVINVKRDPIDDCVNYIVELLDAAAPKLPNLITDRTAELGRITRPIALALKAKVLLMAASPLFNGNSDYTGFMNIDGTPLFNSAYDENKWILAAEAAKAAIDAAEEAGHKLYVMPTTSFSLSDTTMIQLSIRQAVCERYNDEIVWANSNSTTGDLQLQAMAPLSVDHNHNNARKIMSPPLKVAKQFYTRNGVPMGEDRTLSFGADNELRTAIHEERFYISENFQTARLNFDREPRFYASLAFDGAIWYKYDSPSRSDENTFVVRAKFTDYAGSSHAFHVNETGYMVKKLVDWTQTMSSSGASYRAYAWPEIRLADIYLMYAEALNEAYGPLGNEDIFVYLDKVRARAGLLGVRDSWQQFSNNPLKFQSKEGLREIIQQERLIELAFEGHRFWDLRRWKRSASMLNGAITGWNVSGETTNSYYQVRTVYQQQFVSPRDYFWPLNENDLIRNPNLVQNPGW